VTASGTGASLQIHDSEFHYFGPVDTLSHRVPGVTTRIGDMRMFRVLVRPVEGRPQPIVESSPYKLSLDEGAWAMTAVPARIVSPEEAVRRLKRAIPGDPYRSPRHRLPGDRTRHDLFDLNLVRIGEPGAANARADFRWAGLAAAFGFRGAQAEFFARTGPLGRWVWWTVVEQERADPAADPRRAGTARRVLEYIYIDATTGTTDSHCHGADQRPVRC
jgi:hypothetical protein